MKKFLTSVLFFLQVPLIAQVDRSTDFAATITPEDLKDHLTIIASDALEGRNTGSRGQKMAAAYIAEHFKKLGLQPPANNSFFQPITLYSPIVKEALIKAGDQKFNNYTDIIYLGDTDSRGERTMEVVFAGVGRDEDFKNLNVKGKAVLVLREELEKLDMTNLQRIHQTALQAGAEMILYTANFNTKKFQEFGSNLKSYLQTEDWALESPKQSPIDSGSFLITASVAEKIMNIKFTALQKFASSPAASLQKIKNGKVTFQVTLDVRTLDTENVFGYMEGTDKKNEVIIVTAHYDHVGKDDSLEGDKIYNGADDDGSGTVAVLEIAQAFAEAKKMGYAPRRSMLFMTVTAEEIGLLGSEYYANHPVLPIAQTVCNLNIDMIGRSDATYEKKPDYLYVIGSDKLSKELHTLHEQVNQKYTKLHFDYVYNDEAHPDRLYYRSDHWNFAKNNIPVIFYFDGIHSDYHQVSDEVNKINFDQLTKRTRLVFHTAWEVANRDQRLKLD